MVGPGDPGAADLDLALAYPVPRQHLVVLADKPHLHSVDDPARAHPPVQVLGCPLGHSGGRQRQPPHRAHLRHAPALDDAQAVAVLESLQHYPGRGGAARVAKPQRGQVDLVRLPVVQDRVPDGRHARGDGRPLGGDKRGQVVGLQEWRRHVQRRAGKERRVRQAPRVGVEHRHDRHRPVRLGDAERRRYRRHRMQVGGPVRVDHALRVPGRAAGVAHQRRGPLVQLRPVEVRAFGGQQLVVPQYAVAERRRVAGTVDDERLDSSQLVANRRQQRDQRVVHDDDPVPGVIDDPGHLRAGQPDVERVQHRAHGGHPEVRLEVLLVVPAEGPDRVAGSDAQPRQRARQPSRVGRHLLVRRASGARTGPRHALAAAVYGGAVAHDRAYRERVVLHGATDHRVPSPTQFRPCLLGGTVGRIAARVNCPARWRYPGAT